MLYRLILKARDKAYRSGRRPSEPASVPTICVGNVTVGGTGKTPHTELILSLLGGGSDVAMLSRGYKRKGKGYAEVQVDGSAAVFGDEPLQIKKSFPSVRVAVDKDRLEGCRLLAEAGARTIVLDDAFQYRKLKASLNVVLVDYNRPVHKDSLLPFGRLRDLAERLFDADVIVVTKCPYLFEKDKEEFVQKMMASAPEGKKIPVLFSRIEYCDPMPVFESTDMRWSYSKEMILFSGIANDKPLKRFLSDAHHVFSSIKFSDHHAFSRADIRKIVRQSRKCPIAGVATTQKDAQRMLDCKWVPDSLKEKMFYVPIRVQFCSEEESSVFAEMIRAISRVSPSNS